jgi:hypothetical protein
MGEHKAMTLETGVEGKEEIWNDCARVVDKADYVAS